MYTEKFIESRQNECGKKAVKEKYYMKESCISPAHR
jgi:hypothetical protein